jgi:hypothetical protein
MAQNYANAHLKVLDERFTTDSKTSLIVNNGIRLDFNGKKSVTIYNVDTVVEGNYTRSGSDRFGSLVELGTGEQTFTLTQDKAATWTIDRGNYSDSMMVTEAAESVKRQTREVSVPTVDIYTLGIITSYAATKGTGWKKVETLTNTGIYAAILAGNAVLDDREVPEDDRVLFITPTKYNFLKRDPEFVRDCDTSVRDLKKGILGEVDGLTIVKCPTSYFTANTNFIIVSKNVVVRPTKFNSVRTLDEVQGIDGWVVEMRRYYDVFIPTNKGDAIYWSATA